ncbi:MAG: amidohydrolase family protein [Acidobacteriia bacterium]|nr:amidohydrolase family protein [Terriglobia bacterium]
MTEAPSAEALRLSFEWTGGLAAEGLLFTPYNSQLATHAAIDVLFHPSSRTSPGSCPLHPPSEAQLDQAGIGQALVSQCKKWSCERQWMCVDTRLEDVLRYTESSSRFIGLAGYNPFDITESLREIELAVTAHAFRGVYLHADSFKLPLTDARIYPLFAKAAELAVPVLVQLPATCNLPDNAGQLVCDFQDLSLVLAQLHPQLADIAAIAGRCENVFFALDPGALVHLKESWRARHSERDDPQSNFFSGVFQERCMWGSNGMDWSDALRAADSLPMLPETREHFLRLNARRVFAFDQPPVSRTPRSALTEILAAER